MFQLHMGSSKLNICICKPQMSNTCTKCIYFYVFRSTMFGVVMCFSNLMYVYVFPLRFKEFESAKNDMSSFLFNLSNTKKKQCLCMEVLL